MEFEGLVCKLEALAVSAGSGGVNLQAVATCFEDAGLRLTKAFEVPMGARVCKATEDAELAVTTGAALAELKGKREEVPKPPASTF